MASNNSFRDDSLSSSPIAVSDSGGALVGDAYPEPPGSQIGSAAGSFQNDVGPLGGGDSGGGGSGSSSDAEFGFGRAEFGQSPLAGTVQIYERHVFLCYKTPDVWPAHVEAAEFDRLPRLLSAALLARKGEMKRQTRLTICEGEDGTETSNGDVLIFPDMIRYRSLTHFDVDAFVEEVLVKDTEWLPGTSETLKGSYVFVCSHGSRDRRCGACGPVLVRRFKEEIKSHALHGLVSVSPCSHIGGHKYAGNIIIFSSSIDGAVTGHWYGYVTPDDVPILLEQHIGKGEIVDRLWRGQMGLSEEDQKKAQAFRLQLPGEISEREKTSKESKQPIQQNAVANGNTTEKINCCQGSGNISCCGNPLPPEEKPGNTNATEHEAKPINSYRSSKSCYSRKSCSMPTWFESWEREDTYATIAVVAAVASVAVAIRCYRQL
ncbi:hypothetical protein QJS10_CPB15g01024 [Acorus calamus]|uniref:Sucrase n=1 Tax=Acorus calamus TaxID=4465 RepID=A0AAV9D537_ACOCL|nr:hypothetical protein QJS10_CPB15g01024 [Acorus calamus]